MTKQGRKLPITSADVAIGIRLRARRHELGLPMKFVGQQMRCSGQLIQKWEIGGTHISAVSLARLAQIYDKPIEWFFAVIPGIGLTNEPTEPDLGTRFVAAEHGGDLARAYLQIDYSGHRRLVLATAQRIVRDQATQLGDTP